MTPFMRWLRDHDRARSAFQATSVVAGTVGIIVALLGLIFFGWRTASSGFVLLVLALMIDIRVLALMYYEGTARVVDSYEGQ